MTIYKDSIAPCSLYLIAGLFMAFCIYVLSGPGDTVDHITTHTYNSVRTSDMGTLDPTDDISFVVVVRVSTPRNVHGRALWNQCVEAIVWDARNHPSASTTDDIPSL